MIFLLVIDELDLEVEFVHQFEHPNFEPLGRSIFPGNSFWFDRQWSLENSVTI